MITDSNEDGIANLIAAAPEMLKTLQLVSRSFADVALGNGGWAWEEILDDVNEAIRKATGQ